VIAQAGTLAVTAPSNRADIIQDVDVIEEIARMIGFDHIPSKLPLIKSIIFLLINGHGRSGVNYARS